MVHAPLAGLEAGDQLLRVGQVLGGDPPLALQELRQGRGGLVFVGHARREELQPRVDAGHGGAVALARALPRRLDLLAGLGQPLVGDASEVGAVEPDQAGALGGVGLREQAVRGALPFLLEGLQAAGDPGQRKVTARNQA